MSKCELRIVFDRTDRTYRGGEEVTGEVHVRVNSDVTCNGLRIEHLWQTHGRGNRDSGPIQKKLLFRGQWRAGESFCYPFRFKVPAGPPTYHGKYLNIDHYISVRADVPWALDPKLKEEYILVPGPKPYGPRSLAGQRQQLKSSMESFGALVGVVMIIFGIIFVCPFGIILIPGGLIALFLGLRRTLAEQKLGKVRLKLGSHTTPGGRLSVRVTFKPRRSSDLNGITAQLVGQEECTSGSGTRRTTRTHKFHTSSVTLAGQGKATAGSSIRIDGHVPIPQINAYSFSASNNKIVWQLEIRVDVPMWPDWLEKRTIVVRPAPSDKVIEAKVVSPRAGKPSVITVPVAQVPPLPPQPESQPRPPAAAPPLPPAAETPAPIDESEVPEPQSESVSQPPGAEVPLPPAPETPASETPASETPAPVDEPEVPEPQPQHEAEDVDSPSLTEIVERITAANRYGREREEIVAEQLGKTFDCCIQVANIERTYSAVTEDRFRNGRTLIGELSDCKVSVQLSAARNEEVDAVQSGSTFRVTCKLSKWNSIYDRLDTQEV